MADEQTQTIDQTAMADNFQNEFVSQEVDEVLADPNNGQTMASEPVPAQAVAPAAAPVQTALQPAASAPGSIPAGSAPVVDELMKPFQDEKGQFSADKWIQHFNQQHKSIAPVNVPIEAAQPGAQQDTRQPWEKMLEEQEQYQTTLSGNLMAWKDKFIEALQAGYDQNQAVAYADGQINSWLQKHVARRNAEAQFKAQQEGMTKQQDAVEMARLKPVSDANYTLVAAEFGGVDKLHQLLTHKDLAGDHVYWLFERDNTGKKFASEAERDQAIDNWFVKISQNPDNIRRLARYGLSMYKDKYFPTVVEHIKKGQQAAPAARRVAVTPQSRTVTQSAPKASPDALDIWNTQPGQRDFVSQEA